MEIRQKDFDTLILCAFGYALGRKTYIVDDICSLINFYKAIIPEWILRQIQKEIAYAVDRDIAGMDMDVTDWKALSRDIGYYLAELKDK